MTDFDTLMNRAMQIRALYQEFETSHYGKSWTREEIMLGFAGDVGDLAKLVMANEGVRQIDEPHEKLAHELADCLWSLLVLSKLYSVDLETAFMRTMTERENHLNQEQID